MEGYNSPNERKKMQRKINKKVDYYYYFKIFFARQFADIV